jgi:putative flippase GtrA
MLWAGVEIAHASLFLSNIAATGTVFFWNYFARRHLVFGAPRG